MGWCVMLLCTTLKSYMAFHASVGAELRKTLRVELDIKARHGDHRRTGSKKLSVFTSEPINDFWRLGRCSLCNEAVNKADHLYRASFWHIMAFLALYLPRWPKQHFYEHTSKLVRMRYVYVSFVKTVTIPRSGCLQLGAVSVSYQVGLIRS